LINIIPIAERLPVMMDDFVFQDIDFFSSVESTESNHKSDDKSDNINDEDDDQKVFLSMEELFKFKPISSDDKTQSFKNTRFEIKSETKSHRLNRKVYKCLHCSKEFNKNSNLNVHIRDLHGTYKSSEVICTICEEELKNPGSLKTHRANHGNTQGLVCPHCSKQFYKSSNMTVHIRDVHGTYDSSEVKCTICEKELKNPGSLYSHVRIVHKSAVDRETHVCEKCGKAFKSRKNLTSHTVSTHTIDKKKCDFCFNILKNAIYLQQHLSRVHGPIKTVPCEICLEPFKNKARLRNHHIHKHIIVDSHCEHRGKTYKNKSLLKKHARYMHTNGK
jgi:KRAB domain-containing zinc finger protein